MTKNKKAPRDVKIPSFPISLYHMELNATASGASVILGGIKGVVEVSDEFIKIMTKSGTVSIVGSGLIISVFEYKTLQISGKIENISFSNKNKIGRQSQ